MVSNSGTIQSDDRAEVAGFSPSVDLDLVAPGSTFQASWIFRNSGATAWDSGYHFVFTDEAHPETTAHPRSPMGSAGQSAITAIGAPPRVNPGETVQLTLTFSAPNEAGTYATNWQLRAPDGRLFGPIRWLRAVVVDSPGEAFDYELLDFRNSVSNFTNMQPGRKFSGIWKIRNIGSKLWSGDFQVEYFDQVTAGAEHATPSPMGAKASIRLAELTNRDNVGSGETVDVRLDLVAPQQPGAYVFNWQLKNESGQAFGGNRWLQIGVEAGPSIDPESEGPEREGSAVEFGMNVNPNNGHGLDVDRLRGLSWVRFVYWASREGKSPEQAYHDRYKHIIQSYANAGIKSLIILHQDTEWGNAPWDNGGWDEYAQVFAKACGRVARVCSEFGHMVAYQIYNEQDSGFGSDAGHPNPSAIGIAPGNYSIVLDKASAAIRSVDPGATIIFGGLKTGPSNAAEYTKQVRRELAGRLPVDALAYHPYGRFVHNDPFYDRKFGTLQDALRVFKTTFPRFPLWITEIGVADDNPIGPENYPKIASYLREFFNEVADNHASHVPVLIWFAWSDIMRNAGITTASGSMKEHVGDAFREMVARGQAQPASAQPARSTTGLGFAAAVAAEANSEFVTFTTTLADHNAVPAGSSFTNRWTFKNTGNTSWGDNYRLVYAPPSEGNSDPMTGTDSFALADVAEPRSVPPGAEAQIKLEMTAPGQPGRHTVSRWELRDPSDRTFGHLFAEITVAPAPTTGTNVRSPGMTFVRDQTIADGTPLVAGSDFEKQWLVRNSGGRKWGPGFRLVFVQGDLQMARGVAAHMVPEARAGEEAVLSIAMNAPPAVGGQRTPYGSLWRLQDDRGNIFGDPIWAKMVSTPFISDAGGQTTALARLLNDPSIWYSQQDPRWSDHGLGHGNQTIGSWGCLMTCMAMGLTAFGHPFSPADLNRRLKEIGAQGFVGSAVQFIAPFHMGGLSFRRNVRSWPDSDVPGSVWTGEDPIARIDQALAEGNIVVAQVDTKPNNALYDSNIEQHWVIIVKRTPAADDYHILDPLVRTSSVQAQPLSLMAKYGSRNPSQSHEVNLRNAIKSTLVYYKPGGQGG